MMKDNRVLVVHKILELDKQTPPPRRRSHQPHLHNETLHVVRATLEELRIPYCLLERQQLSSLKNTHHPLIITVGGDGTVLAAVHVAGTTPLLGVNSRPGKSIGFYCAATKRSFPRLIRRMLTKRWRPTSIPLLSAKINGRPLPFLALNDVLFSNRSPSDLVSYRLSVGRKHEWQRGSGLWICAGPGSTAGYRSAGGQPVSITSTTLRFLVREPCPFPHRHFRLLRGCLPLGKKLTLRGDGGGGLVCLDGPSHIVELKAGDVLTVQVARQRLSMYLSTTPKR